MDEKKAVGVLESNRIIYDHLFSIVSHHRRIGTSMWQNPDGSWQMHDLAWMSSKGIYACANKIDLHFDDDIEYLKYFPKSCIYVVVPKEGFEQFRYIFDF